MNGLYIHIPFCVRKCSYCDFYSLPNRQSSIADYVRAVLREAQSHTKNNTPASLRAKRGKLREEGPSDDATAAISSPLRGEDQGEGVPLSASFQTLYLGGGTPSLLGPQNLQSLISGLSGVFNLDRLSVGSGFRRSQPEVLDCYNPMYELARPNLLGEEQIHDKVSPLAPGGRESERGGLSNH